MLQQLSSFTYEEQPLKSAPSCSEKAQTEASGKAGPLNSQVSLQRVGTPRTLH